MASIVEKGPSRRAQGREAESLVLRMLEKEGWFVLARNWYGGGSEIDIIVRRDLMIRFVEVKERDADDLCGIEAVDRGKQRHLVRAAEAFLSGYNDPWDEACFLVAFVERGPQGTEVTFIDNAFDVG
jgi:putative endonuclease